MNINQLWERTEELALTACHTSLQAASPAQLHNALAQAVMMDIAPQWAEDQNTQLSKRCAYYLSAEYLVGRMVYNNLYALGALEEAKALFAQKGVDLALMEDVEDAALGNGGLGRLAACFLDSAATHAIPLFGYGLRYRYGLFKQDFVDFRQHEMPDDWTAQGDPWSIRRADLTVYVTLRNLTVAAVPYDMPIIGYQKKCIGTLRLWQCESVNEMDFALFNEQHYAKAARGKNEAEDITKLLYPNDTLRAGKQLRIKQQYVLCSATLQDVLRRYKTEFGTDYSHFAARHALQLNDTHPTMAIPELVRLLTADGVAFDEAVAIARQTFAYTNHTVMQEALEAWDVNLLASVVPELVRVIRRIDLLQMTEMNAADIAQAVQDRVRIIRGGRVHMADLAVYGSQAVNGVAQLHTEILKNDVLADWYQLRPECFQNKTNGITQRRWLGLCNPELGLFLKERIGDGYLTNLYELEKLRPMIDDALAEKFISVKLAKKEQLSKYILQHEGVLLPPDFVYDVQIKRLHEYKRQLLNAFSILHIYFALKEGKLQDMPPVAMIFGAKAAPGYMRAKAVIRYINQIAALVNQDADTNQRLRVVFVQNYNCSYAEKIIPAADLSEQISPVGTEASGTGNMKLMLNGAATLGTYDGANIEIVEQAGKENNYIFGATLAEILKTKPKYDPKTLYEADADMRRVIDTLIDGTFADSDGALKELHDALLLGASWHKPDHYYLLLDYPSYITTKLQAIIDTKDGIAFARKCLMNIASAGKFSSDRTVAQYAEEIWRV